MTLYRGERASMLPTLQTAGIQAKERWLSQERGFPAIHFEKLMMYVRKPGFLEFVIAEIGPVITKHVVRGKLSPLVSFSANERVARTYALSGGQTAEGLLLTVSVTIVEARDWTAFPEPGSGLLRDHAGRVWVHVPSFREPASAHPAHVPLGRRDDEYLLLGDLTPSDFDVQVVRL